MLSLSALPSAPAALLASLRAATAALAAGTRAAPKEEVLSWSSTAGWAMTYAMLIGDAAETERWTATLALLGAGGTLQSAALEALTWLPTATAGEDSENIGACAALGVFAARWCELIDRQPQDWAEGDAAAADALQSKAAEFLVRSRAWMQLRMLAEEWPVMRRHLVSGTLVAGLCRAALDGSAAAYTLLALVVRDVTPSSAPM